MSTSKPRAVAAALALVAVLSILGTIALLSRNRLASTVVALPTVEIVAVRTAEAPVEHVLR